MSTTPPEDIEISTDMFTEPENYFEPEPEPTFIDFHRSCQFLRPGEPGTINLRLVGKSPLWGHLLWNAGKLTTDYLDEHRDTLIAGKTVLELGAAAALPSLVAAFSAKKVTITDYPDPELITNIEYNVHNGGLGTEIEQKIKVLGYIWGNDVTELLDAISDDPARQEAVNGSAEGHVHNIERTAISTPPTDAQKYDVIILSDLIFNHSEHKKLIASMDKTLKSDGKALVVFSPHRPKLYHKDLEFFTLAKELADFDVVEKFERDYTPMFVEDDETKELRGKAFGYLLQRAKKD